MKKKKDILKNLYFCTYNENIILHKKEKKELGLKQHESKYSFLGELPLWVESNMSNNGTLATSSWFCSDGTREWAQVRQVALWSHCYIFIARVEPHFSGLQMLMGN